MDDYSTLAVCTTHIRLVGMYEGKQHRCACDPGEEGWREREWGGYDVAALVELCSMCAREVVRSGSRWTWRACETCRSVNNAIATAVSGEHDPRSQVIPLGRHSLMNGICVSSEDLRYGREEAAAEELLRFFGFSTRLSDWQQEEGERLVVSGGFDDRHLVVLDDWTTALPASPGASADAICRYVGVDDLPDLPELIDLSEQRHAHLKGSRR